MEISLALAKQMGTASDGLRVTTGDLERAFKADSLYRGPKTPRDPAGTLRVSEALSAAAGHFENLSRLVPQESPAATHFASAASSLRELKNGLAEAYEHPVRNGGFRRQLPRRINAALDDGNQGLRLVRQDAQDAVVVARARWSSAEGVLDQIHNLRGDSPTQRRWSHDIDGAYGRAFHAEASVVSAKQLMELAKEEHRASRAALGDAVRAQREKPGRLTTDAVQLSHDRWKLAHSSVRAARSDLATARRGHAAAVRHLAETHVAHSAKVTGLFARRDQAAADVGPAKEALDEARAAHEALRGYDDFRGVGIRTYNGF